MVKHRLLLVTLFCLLFVLIRVSVGGCLFLFPTDPTLNDFFNHDYSNYTLLRKLAVAIRTDSEGEATRQFCVLREMKSFARKRFAMEITAIKIFTTFAAHKTL